MTNKGINEELLKDIKSLINDHRSEWKKMVEELPPKVSGMHIIVYAVEGDKMVVLYYSKKYYAWVGITEDLLVMRFQEADLIKHFNFWKPLLVEIPIEKI